MSGLFNIVHFQYMFVFFNFKLAQRKYSRKTMKPNHTVLDCIRLFEIAFQILPISAYYTVRRNRLEQNVKSQYKCQIPYRMDQKCKCFIGLLPAVPLSCCSNKHSTPCQFVPLNIPYDFETTFLAMLFLGFDIFCSSST